MMTLTNSLQHEYLVLCENIRAQMQRMFEFAWTVILFIGSQHNTVLESVL